MGASLICMVCNLTLGKPKYAQFEAPIAAALATAEQARHAALQLAEDDARAFDLVIAAYKLPKASEAETAQRTDAIQRALIEAAQVPLRTAELAAVVIRLAADILDISNKTVISDVAIAALSAKTALEASTLNVEINLASITDEAQKTRLADQLAGHRATLAQADQVATTIRERISR